jgi:hypothetical protein
LALLLEIELDSEWAMVLESWLVVGRLEVEPGRLQF